MVVSEEILLRQVRSKVNLENVVPMITKQTLGIQSRYYGGETGGVFSCFQSAGAGGCSCTAQLLAVLIGAIVGVEDLNNTSSCED